MLVDAELDFLKLDKFIALCHNNTSSVPGGVRLCRITHDSFFLCVGTVEVRVVADVFFAFCVILGEKAPIHHDFFLKSGWVLR